MREISKGLDKDMIEIKIKEEEQIRDTVEIDIKGRMRKAEVTKWPFYDPEVYGGSRTQ